MFMDLRTRLSEIKRAFLRAFGWTPMLRVLARMQQQGIDISKRQALEAFARRGDWHTVDYAPKVAHVTAWEIDPGFEKDLRRKLPNGTVKITDSYQEMQTTDKKFDFIVLDAPLVPHGGHVEHFDLFPAVFRFIPDSAVLIINLVPYVDTKWSYPLPFTEMHLKRRAEFYQTDHPENLSFDEMMETYKRQLKDNGFALEWYTIEKRMPCIYYAAMKIKRMEN
jgi:hypothetical protein